MLTAPGGDAADVDAELELGLGLAIDSVDRVAAFVQMLDGGARKHRTGAVRALCAPEYTVEADADLNVTIW